MDVAKHPAVHRTVSTAKDDLSPKVNGAKVKEYVDNLGIWVFSFTSSRGTECMSELERESRSSHLLVHCPPNYPQQLELSRPKLGAGNSIQIFYVSGRNLVITEASQGM